MNKKPIMWSALGVFALLLLFKERVVCGFLGHAYPLRVLRVASWAWQCPRCGFTSRDDADFIPVSG